MNGRLSLRLDSIRVVAALMVFAAHFSYLGYTGPGSGFAHHYGHIGVVVFFVLSGYVIAFVAEGKHPDLLHFGEARVARLYSVLLPALVLTPALDAVGRSMAPSLYAEVPVTRPLFRVLANATFLQQTSVTAVKYFSNGPMWSVAYEAWYYALFGAARWLRGAPRAIAVATLGVIAGHKILLLLPVWLLGVLVRRLHRKGGTPPRRLRRWSLLAAIVAFVACCEYGPCVAWLDAANDAVAHPLVRAGIPLEFSSWFGRDLLLGLIVAAVIAFVSDLESDSGEGWPVRTIRALAQCSFSIYLFHVPLLLALRATGVFRTETVVGAAGLGAATLVACWALARVSEHRLRWYRNAVAVVTSVARRRRRAAR